MLTFSSRVSVMMVRVSAPMARSVKRGDVKECSLLLFCAGILTTIGADSYRLESLYTSAACFPNMPYSLGRVLIDGAGKTVILASVGKINHGAQSPAQGIADHQLFGGTQIGQRQA